MTRGTIPAELALRVEKGNYVVNARAVAEAIVRHSSARPLAARVSQMLVARELRRPSAGIQEHGAAAFPDAA